jgi:AcrR family transcriptional regulator
MSRTRTIPDAQVFAAVQRLLDEGGDKAVSFRTVGLATGLAPPTLVQRYGSRDKMVQTARQAAWDALDQRTFEAIRTKADKGPQGLLKAIGQVDASHIAGDLGDVDLSLRANAWRAAVETALAARLGGGVKARESAALLFAAWQGQALWSRGDKPGFRLKDAVKRLT